MQDDLTEQERKILTGYLGECRHEHIDKYWIPNTGRCADCGLLVVEGELIPNRTFTTWQDFGDLKDKLEEKGDWDYALAWMNDEFFIQNAHEDNDFTQWLLNPTRFSKLLVGWLKGE